MGKVEDKKKIKRETLLGSAFSLFTTKGINSTSISDIVKNANLAKGTFYLYFKDKFDIRDKLIAAKASQLLNIAIKECSGYLSQNINTEKKIVYLADSIINQLEKDKVLLRFISKNLSWGIFDNVMLKEPESKELSTFYEAYKKLLKQSNKKYKNESLMIFMIVELISSTCYNVILYEEPVSLKELKPQLYKTICEIMRMHEVKE